LRWLDAAASKARTAALRTPHSYVPPNLAPAAKRSLAKARLVALGPDFTVPAGSTDHELHPAWWIDEARPGQIWLALSADLPPLLWLAGGATAASVQALWAKTMRDDVVDNRDRKSAFWFFGGLMANPPFGFYELEDWMVTCPFTTGFPYLLGTAVPMRSDKVDMYEEPSHTSRFVTAFSHAMIEFTGLHRAVPSATLLHGVITYQPDFQPDVVAAFNSATGADYPPDMPVDVICTLMRYLGLSEAALGRRLEADPEGKVENAQLFLLAQQLLLDRKEGNARLLAWSKHQSPFIRDGALIAAAMMGDVASVALFLGDPLPALAARAAEIHAQLTRSSPRKATTSKPKSKSKPKPKAKGATAKPRSKPKSKKR
jgi:hypothetical protein